jgi:hypothetical protein
MIIKMMRSLEDWQNSPEVQRVIDAAETASGFHADSYDVYDDFIDYFRLNVVQRLHDEGCTIVWHHHQSRGVGCIFQGHNAECEAVFDAAMEACKDTLFNDCVEFGRAESKNS